MSLRTAVTVATRVPRIRSSAMTTKTARLAPRTQFVPATRRNVGGTSTPPHSSKSWDVPWIVGSVVVIVPLAYYFVGRSATRHGDNIANDASKVPVGQKTSGGLTTEDVRENIQQATSGDSKTGYKPNASSAAQRSRTSGDLSADDVSDSINRSLQADAPKTAYKAEEEKAKRK